MINDLGDMSVKISNNYNKFQQMAKNEQLSVLFLLPATVLYTVAVGTPSWFELPGVAWYGLWSAEFFDDLGVLHFVPAFFTNEPGFYHLLQIVCLFAWAGLGLSLYMLLSNKIDYKIPRFLRKNTHHAIAALCFASVFAMSGGLYLFYYIINTFPRDANSHPEVQWAAVLAGLACVFEFIAGLLLIQL